MSLLIALVPTLERNERKINNILNTASEQMGGTRYWRKWMGPVHSVYLRYVNGSVVTAVSISLPRRTFAHGGRRGGARPRLLAAVGSACVPRGSGRTCRRVGVRDLVGQGWLPQILRSLALVLEEGQPPLASRTSSCFSIDLVLVVVPGASPWRCLRLLFLYSVSPFWLNCWHRVVECLLKKSPVFSCFFFASIEQKMFY